jgi:hypothetical protein
METDYGSSSGEKDAADPGHPQMQSPSVLSFRNTSIGLGFGLQWQAISWCVPVIPIEQVVLEH